MRERRLGSTIARPAPVVEPGQRYAAGPSRVAWDQWVIVDQTAGLCVRSGASIRRFGSRSDAEAAARRLNTERVICVACRHKALASECELRVCPSCRELRP